MDIDVSKIAATSTFKVDRLFVTVYPLGKVQEIAFQGFARSVSSVDLKGPFDILPTHENFITQFRNKLEVIREDGQRISFDKTTGVIEVANNVVKVFLQKT